MPRSPVRRHLRSLAKVQAVLVTTVFVGGLTTAATATTVPVPATPRQLPAGIEALQPYVGQSSCDPVAKPGVRAFSNLLLDTYTDTTSLGIVRDCGIGGQSEHKEGRAFDWGVSVNKPHQVAEVNALLSWLTKKDSAGNPAANARRLGIMYMIWNKRVWKAYQIDKGWQAYTGAEAHTDHVHFSFGWNGAKKATSWWTGKVAAIDYSPTVPAPAPAPRTPLTPARLPTNLLVLATYGATVLKQPSGASLTRSTADPAATKIVQAALEVTPDGDFGPQTTAALKSFQSDHGLTVDGVVDANDWKALFPKPQIPFGKLESVTFGISGTVAIRGWAADADTQDPIKVHLYVDGKLHGTVTAAASRPDIEKAFPGMGPELGYGTTLNLAAGTHAVCATAVNVGPGSVVGASTGCLNVRVGHAPFGHSDALRLVPGGVVTRGWVYDPDTTAAVKVSYTVDGAPLTSVIANKPRPDIARLYPPFGGNRGYSDLVSLARVTAGNHLLCAVATNLGPGSDSTLGCLVASVRHTPFGSFETLRQQPGVLVLAGWAVEPDVAGPAALTATLDGRAIRSIQAALPRPDIARLYPAYGSGHGFSATVPVPAAAGNHTVCLTVTNAGPGRRVAARCRTLSVVHKPVGRFEAGTVARQLLTIKGWALDPDAAKPIAIRVRVDGSIFQTVAANRSRADVARAYPGYGAAHGFNVTLTKALSTGRHQVCVDAINTLAGSGDRYLSCRTFAVS